MATYLLGRHFVIETDQKSLRELMSQVVQTPDQHYYLSKLLGYDYEIKYKPGKNNKAIDALSRLHFPPDSVLLILSIVSLDFLSQVKQEYANCDIIRTLKQEFLAEPTRHPDITYINGMFYHKSRVLLSPASALKHSLLHEFHTSPTGGHTGISRTYSRLNAIVTSSARGLTSTTRPPKFRLGRHFNGFHCRITFVQRPYSHFVSCGLSFQGFTLRYASTDFTAFKISELFTSIFCKHHSFPRSIILDRDPIFLSNFWKTLFKLHGTKLRMNSAYHPETDG